MNSEWFLASLVDFLYVNLKFFLGFPIINLMKHSAQPSIQTWSIGQCLDNVPSRQKSTESLRRGNATAESG